MMFDHDTVFNHYTKLQNKLHFNVSRYVADGYIVDYPLFHFDPNYLKKYIIWMGEEAENVPKAKLRKLTFSEFLHIFYSRVPTSKERRQGYTKCNLETLSNF